MKWNGSLDYERDVSLEKIEARAGPTWHLTQYHVAPARHHGNTSFMAHVDYLQFSDVAHGWS